MESYLCVLDAIVLGAAFPEGASITADDGRVTEVRVHTIESRGIRNSHIDLVTPSHGFADLDLST